MGYRDLIESLRKEGDDNINRLWSKVKEEADKINAETSSKINELRERYRKEEEIKIRQQEYSIFLEAKNRARLIRLSGEQEISKRLFPIALSLLQELRNERYKEVFASLIKELPDTNWDEVRTNPQDVPLAQEHFPDAQVIPEDTISGGLEVIREDGRICVVNTFEKRLENAWEDIQPLLINDIYKEVFDYEPSRKP